MLSNQSVKTDFGYQPLNLFPGGLMLQVQDLNMPRLTQPIQTDTISNHNSHQTLKICLAQVKLITKIHANTRTNDWHNPQQSLPQVNQSRHLCDRASVPEAYRSKYLVLIANS